MEELSAFSGCSLRGPGADFTPDRLLYLSFCRNAFIGFSGSSVQAVTNSADVVKELMKVVTNRRSAGLFFICFSLCLTATPEFQEENLCVTVLISVFLLSAGQQMPR